MLTSRDAEIEKRNRISQKGKDGGSFIPRAILIKGTLNSGALTSIALPSYINYDNFLTASIAIEYDGTGVSATDNYDSGDLIIDSSAVRAITVSYQTGNTIDINNSNYANKDYKLTVFYKG
jgi:hypothetical protein